jgi:hypothetical protein
MTSEQKRQFENQWPAVAARLERMLARRGIPEERRDDIVQETGLRLLRSWHKVDAARPLWPFTVTIALNLMRDQARRSDWGEVLTEFPDRQDATDVEHLATKRLELRQAGRALALLKPGQRDVLLAEVEPSMFPATGTPAATKMLRMRARRRLAALMQQVSALGIAVTGPIRRLGRSSHLLPYRSSAEALVPAVCGVLCAFAVVGAGSLAPFSTLPPSEGSATDADALLEGSSTGDLATTSSVAGAATTSSADSALVQGGPRAYRPEQSRGGADPRGPLPPEDHGISHRSYYEIPLGQETLVHGSVTVEIHHGGDGGPPPASGDGSLDCSEQMITPNQVDARCWRSGDPQRRYGVRVKHEGRTTATTGVVNMDG